MSEQNGATPTPESGAPAQQQPVDSQTTTTGNEPTKQTADPAAKPSKPQRREGGFQRRINELTHQVREGQRQNERLIAVLEAQQRGAQDDKPPTPDQFATLAEYTNAQVAYALKKAGVPSKQETRDDPSAQRTRGEQNEPDPEFAAAIDDMVTEGSEKYEDFEELMDSAKFITPVMARAIVDSENAVEIAYHLFNDQKEARRIAQLPPRRQFMEIGRLEAKLEGRPAPKKPSNAPEPLTPVNGGTPASDGTPSDKDDIKVWMTKRNKQARGS